MPHSPDLSDAAHLAAVYATLSETNEAVLRAENPQDLYDRVCAAGVTTGVFKLIAVYVAEPGTLLVRPCAVAGTAAVPLGGGVGISLDPTVPEGRGVIGTAWRTGESCISNDYFSDPRTVPWHAVARPAQFASSAAVPLWQRGAVTGVLAFFSVVIGAFDAPTVALIERMARNIDHGLENLRRAAEQGAALELLAESERRFRNIVDSMQDAYYEVDLRGFYRYFNDAFVRLFGRDAEAFRGVNNTHFQTPEMARRAAAIFKEVYQTGVAKQGQIGEHLHRDGRVVVTEGTVHLNYDGEGRKIGFFGVLRDVTARLQTDQALRESEERYRSTVESISDAYYEVDLVGILRHVNPAFCRLLGSSAEQLVGRSFRDFQRLEVAQATYQTFHEAFLARKPIDSFDWELRHSDGHLVLGEGSVQPVLTADGSRVTGFRGILRDVTERRAIEAALRASEVRFRALAHLSSDWFWELDDQLRFTVIEGRASTSNTLRRQFVGRHPWETDLVVDSPGGWGSIGLEERTSFRDVVLRRTDPSGNLAYLSASGEPVLDEGGTFRGYRGILREITQQKLAEDHAQFLATHDALTGLPNRVMFSQFLHVAIELGRRNQTSFAVLFIDLDRFKFVNDTLGHAAGDQLLQAVAERFQSALRASDVLARLGGDEFVVLALETESAEQAASVAGKLIAAAARPVAVMNTDCRVTASVGIALFPQHGDDERTLIKNADIAMYFAKERGKNNAQFYSVDIQAQASERLTIETHLRDAVERGELTLHYQAKRHLHTGVVGGVEALLRWNSPTMGMVAPNRFIPLAEETGLIVPIGRWVLHQACRQAMAWAAEGLPPVCVAVNLSARQFEDESLLDDLAAVLAETALPPASLELEITEGMVMHDPAGATAQLRAIKAMGVRLAIDDFGTGYSSLAQLKTFPIDTLKIDRSFVRDLATNAEDQAIAQAILALGKTLSLTVVAEGVETMEQEQYLRDHGCDEMQGYYFSRPVPPESFADLLRQYGEGAVGSPHPL